MYSKKIYCDENCYLLEIENENKASYFVTCYKFYEEAEEEENKEELFTIYLKWDGCWQFNSNFHLCDFNSEFNQLFSVLKDIFEDVKHNFKIQDE